MLRAMSKGQTLHAPGSVGTEGIQCMEAGSGTAVPGLGRGPGESVRHAAASIRGDAKFWRRTGVTAAPQWERAILHAPNGCSHGERDLCISPRFKNKRM